MVPQTGGIVGADFATWPEPNGDFRHHHVVRRGVHEEMAPPRHQQADRWRVGGLAMSRCCFLYPPSLQICTRALEGARGSSRCPFLKLGEGAAMTSSPACEVTKAGEEVTVNGKPRLHPEGHSHDSVRKWKGRGEGGGRRRKEEGRVCRFSDCQMTAVRAPVGDFRVRVQRCNQVLLSPHRATRDPSALLMPMLRRYRLPCLPCASASTSRADVGDGAVAIPYGDRTHTKGLWRRGQVGCPALPGQELARSVMPWPTAGRSTRNGRGGDARPTMNEYFYPTSATVQYTVARERVMVLDRTSGIVQPG